MSKTAQLDFGGRVVLVTGAARGLGRDYALLLAKRGARVVVNDINLDGAEGVVSEIVAGGGTAVADGHSVVDEATAIMENATEAFGRLNGVINNAAIQRPGYFAEQDPGEWWSVFDASFRGTVEISRAAWPHLAAAGTGVLVNVISTAMLGGVRNTAYASAKAAVWGLSNSLAREGAEQGVRVHAVQPTAYTPLVEEHMMWIPEVADTFRKEFGMERVAAFIVWLVHQDTKVSGAGTKTFRVGGGHSRRAAFAVTPAVRPTSQTPEGWADVADELLVDPANLIHSWDMDELVRLEFETANPDLIPVLKTKPMRDPALARYKPKPSSA